MDMTIKAVRDRLIGTKATSPRSASQIVALHRKVPEFGRFILHVFLILLSVSCLLPLIWMISTSFKEQFQVFTYPPEWLPNPWTLKGYQRLFSMSPVGNWLLNSVFVAVNDYSMSVNLFLTSCICLFTCSLSWS